MFWNQFIGVDGTATYAIAQSPQADSEIFTAAGCDAVTFGGPGSCYDTYKTDASLEITATASDAGLAYNTTTFGFGMVDYDDGTAENSYFYNFTEAPPVVWTPSFQGMGIPSTMYSEYALRLYNVTEQDASCVDTEGGLCTLPDECDEYDDLFEEYSF